MKANELRINNYVFNGNNYPFKIESIVSDYNTGGYSTDTLKPIPLTEQWLLDFGFEQKDKYGYMSLYYRELKRHYLLYRVGNTHLEMCLGDSTTAQCPMEYVHQLQNLYFALTGQELTLKQK